MRELKQVKEGQSSLEALHRQSRSWCSEIKLWEAELVFFQKLQNSKKLQFKTPDEKTRMGHFQKLHVYYEKEVFARFRKMVRDHERFLANGLGLGRILNEDLYRKKHAEVKDHITSFRQEFNMHKREFFELMERFF